MPTERPLHALNARRSDEFFRDRVVPVPRAPALPVAIGLIVGILIDRMANVGAAAWLAGAAMALVVSRRAERSGAARIAALSLLVVCCCVGGMRHHLRWWATDPHEVSRHAQRDPILVKLVGVIESPVTVAAADHSDMTPPWMQVDRSQCDLQCERLVGLAGDFPVTGRLRMMVTGHLLHASVGDRVEIIGRLAKPHGPQNPGGFDFREHLRQSGIRCLLDVEHPEAVHIVQSRATGRLSRLRAQLRDECEQLLVHQLDRRSVPLAMSLLLGERSLLPDEIRDAFAESGMTHVLAISGLHVGILAGLLVVICRGMNLSVPVTAMVLLMGIATYAFVTNHRPPVIRAGVLAATVALGWPWFRRAGGINLIALCAVVVLMINPTDLFDLGTQLSFLSVMAIAWAVSAIARWRRDAWRAEWSSWLFDPRAGIGTNLLRGMIEGYIVTAAIWFVTLPLIVARFHIVAPVGFLLNVLLIPLVGVILWFGFATLLCGLLAPWLVRVPAAAFDLSLRLLSSIVRSASDVRLGHASIAGPDDWWLVGFYAMLMAATGLRRRPAVKSWAWLGVWVWVVAGLVVPFLPQRRDGLRCTFLSVGHGCAVVLELPSGETLLYDAGMLGSARRGQTIIQNALWDRRINGIDAIIVSHADIDHFNAAGGLLETMPVGTLLCGQSFLDFGQQPVAELCETASRRRVPIRLLQEGDRLRVGGDDVEMSILHPPPRWRSERDNANSLVLRIRYAGRTILLTGDLEREGIARLLTLPNEQVDVMLSPHHGSPAANPRALNDWASPRYVIVSARDANAADELHRAYPAAREVIFTHDSGAVSVQITATGQVVTRKHRQFEDGERATTAMASWMESMK